MISIRSFYGIGALLMIISVIASIWNVVVSWPFYTNLGAQVSAIVSVLFNVLWAALFGYLYKITPTQNPMQVVNDPKLDNLLKELNNNEEVKNGTNNP